MQPQKQPLTPDQLKAAGYAPVSQQTQDFLTKNSTIPNQNVQQNAIDINKSSQLVQPTVDSANARAQVDKATADAQIRSQNADAAMKELDAKKQNQLIQSGATLESVKGKDGKVSPSDFNGELEKYVNSGGNADEFYNKFQNKYVNPNNIFYETPDNIAVRKVLPEVANIAKSYYGLTKSGPNWEKITKIGGGIGDYFKKTQFGDEIAHDQLLNGLSGEIRNLVGAGQGSGVGRGIQELNNITGLLPASTDSTDTAQHKLDKLDDFMKSVYGTSLKDWKGQ